MENFSADQKQKRDVLKFNKNFFAIKGLPFTDNFYYAIDTNNETSYSTVI